MKLPDDGLLRIKFSLVVRCILSHDNGDEIDVDAVTKADVLEAIKNVHNLDRSNSLLLRSNLIEQGFLKSNCSNCAGMSVKQACDKWFTVNQEYFSDGD